MPPEAFCLEPRQAAAYICNYKINMILAKVKQGRGGNWNVDKALLSHGAQRNPGVATRVSGNPI